MVSGKMEASLKSSGGHVKLFSVKWDTDGFFLFVFHVKEMPRKLFQSVRVPKHSFRLMS